MVFGNSELGAHVRIKLCNFICFRLRSRAACSELPYNIITMAEGVKSLFQLFPERTGSKDILRVLKLWLSVIFIIVVYNCFFQKYIYWTDPESIAHINYWEVFWLVPSPPPLAKILCMRLCIISEIYHFGDLYHFGDISFGRYFISEIY